MSPLHVPEVLIVKGLRQRDLAILEGVDRAMLAIEKGPTILDLGNCLLHATPHADSCVDRVPGMIDRSRLIDVQAGKV